MEFEDKIDSYNETLLWNAFVFVFLFLQMLPGTSLTK